MRPNPADAAAIDMIVGNLHVATSDEDVLALIASRINVDMASPDGYPEALAAEALRVHHANRDMYSRVVTGRIR